MKDNSNPLSCTALIAGIAITVIGGLILAMILGQGPFARVPIRVTPIPTATPEFAQEPAPQVLKVIGHETIQEAGTRRVSLTENQTLIGTADRFFDVLDQERPPYTIFVITGPIDEDLSIWFGGWDLWENASEEHISNEIANKIQEVKGSHPGDYQTRGYRVVSCRSGLSSCEILSTFP